MDESSSVYTLPKLSSKQVDPHDAEDEPEDETYQQHVHDGGDGPNEGVHNHLQAKKVTVLRNVNYKLLRQKNIT